MSSHLRWAITTLVIIGIGFGAFRLIFSSPRSELFAQASDGTSSVLHPTVMFSYPASARTVADAFAAAKVPYYLEDHVTAFPEPSLGIGGVITVQRALPVVVKDGKRSATDRTWQGTVGDLLIEQNIELGQDDKITPALNTALTSSISISITRVAKTNVVETSAIPFQTVMQLDYSRFSGSQQIVQAGSNGVLQKTYLVIRQDGDQISKTLISTVTAKPAISQIIKDGGLDASILQHSSCPQYKDTVVAAAAKYKINANSLYESMVSESNCHSNSVNPNGPYEGLFQYDPGYWTAAAAQTPGFAGADIFNPTAQIYVTAYQWAHGQCRRWPTCHL